MSLALVLSILATLPVGFFHWLMGARLHNPWGLLVLALALPILALYLLRPRQEARPVALLFLWKGVQRDLEASTPFQKLRRHLVLILQLMLLAFLSYGFSQPTVDAGSAAARIIIIDCSASMQSRDSRGRSRIEQARGIAAALIQSMRSGDETLLLAAGLKARTLHTWSRSSESLLAALATLEADDGPAQIEDALRLAVGSLIGMGSETTELVLISDGAGINIEGTVEGLNRLRFESVGEDSSNLAISRVEVQGPKDGHDEPWVLATTESFSAEPASVELLVLTEGRPWAVRRVQLEPGERKTQWLRLPAGFSGLVELRLQATNGRDPLDALEIDDRAYAVVPAPEPWPVAVIGKVEEELIDALSVDERVLIQRWDDWPEVWPAGLRFIVVAGLELSESKVLDLPVSTLLIACRGAWPGGRVGEDLKPGLVTSWDRENPILRFAPIDELEIFKGQALVLSGQSRSLIERGGRPVAATIRVRELEHVVFGPECRQTNWPQLISFPIVLRNLVTRSAQDAFARAAKMLKVGEPLRLYGAGDNIELRDPRGGLVRVPLRDSQGVYTATERVGFYESGKDQEKQRFAVNLCDPSESKIGPQRRLELAGQKLESSGGQRARSLVELVLLIALALSLVEWYAWRHRIS